MGNKTPNGSTTMKKSIFIPYDRYLYYKRLQGTSKDKYEQIKEAEQHTSEQQNPELEAENEHATVYSPTQTYIRRFVP